MSGTVDGEQVMATTDDMAGICALFEIIFNRSESEGTRDRLNEEFHWKQEF